MNTPNINVGPQDAFLAVTQALPAAGANVTTGILDLQAIAPNSNAWRLGRLVVSYPNIPGNTAASGVTVAMQVAPPSLTTGAAAIAPQIPPAGAFINAPSGKTITITNVAISGSVAGQQSFQLEFDPTGSVYQFYQFVITVPAAATPAGEVISIAFAAA